MVGNRDLSLLKEGNVRDEQLIDLLVVAMMEWIYVTVSAGGQGKRMMDEIEHRMVDVVSRAQVVLESAGTQYWEPIAQHFEGLTLLFELHLT